MVFALTPEQEAMRDSVRRIVERTIAPLLQQNDRNKPLPKAAFLTIFAELAELGLLAVRLPPSAGGPGIGMLDYGVVFEELPAVVAIALLTHEATAARIHAEGNEEQRERLLPDLLSARKIACTASTEPDAGSDPRGIKTRLERRGEDLLLNGRKMWISSVSASDLVLATCLDCREEGKPGALVKVVVEREHSPFSAREIETIGLNQGLLGECVFEDCRIAPENVIEKGATENLKASWAVNRPLYGLLAVHMAEEALQIALDYAKLRTQFGKPIAAHQLIQKNLSDIVTAITASRLLCHYALSLIDRGLKAEGAAAMAKRFAQNACREAVFEAMNVLGAMGLSKEARIEALYRDIRMLPVPDGTSEILALIHGRELTGMEAFRGTLPSAKGAG